MPHSPAKEYVMGSHPSWRPKLKAYFREFRKEFGQPLSWWEVEIAGECFFDGLPVSEAVAQANYQHECRKANKNA